MSLLLFLALYLGGGALLVALLILGPQRQWSNTIVGRLYRLLTRIPHEVATIFVQILCCRPRRSAMEAVRRCGEAVFEKRNRLLVFFYIALVGAVEAGYFYAVLPRIPSMATRIMSAMAVILSEVVYVAAVRCDPGTVPRGAPLRASDTYDGIVFQKNKDGSVPMCRTCETAKPPRSKHCSLCGRCVRRFDHHCPWIDNDVGERSFRWFLLFVFSHVGTCAMASWQSFRVLRHTARRERMWSQRVFSQGREVPVSTPLVVAWLLRDHPVVFAVGLFTACIAVLLFVFGMYHLTFALDNVTGNECAKIDDIVDTLRVAKDFNEYATFMRVMQRDTQRFHRDVFAPREPSPGGKWSTFLKEEGRRVERALRMSFRERGRWKNIAEVFFPPRR